MVSADLSLIGVAVLINFANIHLKVLRWRALLAARGIHYPLGRAWGAFLSSLYVGMLTPGRVGDVLRIQYLRHDEDTPYAEGLASVVMDRLCDLYVLGFMVAAAIARFSSVVVGDLATIAWLGVGAVVVAPIVLLVPGLAEKTMGVIYSRVAKDSSGLDRFLADRFGFLRDWVHWVARNRLLRDEHWILGERFGLFRERFGFLGNFLNW